MRGWKTFQIRYGLVAWLVLSCCVVAGWARVSLSGAYELPDTGQTRCYDGDGNEISCPGPGQPFFGQDGNYRGPQPAFRDNGNGTVSDLRTGLMWQKGDAQNDDGRTWDDAVDYCAASGLGGHTDWRLPSRRELVSLVNYGTSNPAIDTRYFPDCRSFAYWSGSTYAYYPGYAWGVGFYDGDVGSYNEANELFVRCVREGP